MVAARLTLDPTGNWAGYVQKISDATQLNQSRTHNAVNETTNITRTVGPNWATPAHDKAGNMTTLPDPLGLTVGLTCTYDAWHRLVEVKDGADVVAQYEYDGLNRRVLKRVPVEGEGSASGGGDEYETDYYFHNAAWQVLETRRTDLSSASPDALQPKYQYVWSPRYIDAPILRDENTDTDNLCDDGRIYYLTDANFNVTTLVNTGGTAIERYLYNPYGQPTIYTGTWSSTRSSSSYDNVYLYTGREYDPETGLYHYRNRYYHAQLARFISPDPILYDGGDVNLYRYVSGSPVRAQDPFGLQELDCTACHTTIYDPFNPNDGDSISCIAGCHGTPGTPGPPRGTAGQTHGPAEWNPADALKTPSQRCPNMNAALLIANSVMNAGECKAWFDSRVNDHGANPPATYDIWVVPSLFGAAGSTIPLLGNNIYISKTWCCEPVAVMAGIIIHEVAHHYCPGYGPAGEDCAREGQNACINEVFKAAGPAGLRPVPKPYVPRPKYPGRPVPWEPKY